MYCTLHYVMILQVTNNNCILNNVGGRTFTCNIYYVLCVRYVPVLQVRGGIPKKVDKENVTSLESVFIRHI